MSYKNVYFHRLFMYEQKIEDNTLHKIYKKTEELDKEILKIFSSDEVANQCLLLDKGTNLETLEILNIQDSYIFARIGKMKDIRTMHLRDTKTLISSDIEKSGNQEIEIFTYLLVDRENYIISYLSEQSAPSVYTLGNIFRLYSFNENLRGEVVAIPIKNLLKVLEGKKKITRVGYKVCIPSSSILNIDELNLTEKQFEYYKNLKSVNISVELIGETNKNIVSDSTTINKIVEDLKSLVLGTPKDISIDAKNQEKSTKGEGDYLQTYKIFDDKFCRKVDFTFEKEAKVIKDEIEKKMLKGFESNKSEILEYIS